MKTGKLSLFVAATLAASLLCSGIGSAADRTVKVAIGSTSFAWFPLYVAIGGGFGHRGGAVVVGEHGVGAGGDEVRGEIGVLVVCGPDKSGCAFAVAGVDVGALLKKSQRGCAVVDAGGLGERRVGEGGGCQQYDQTRRC